MNLFIIPSWYPSESKPLSGVFIQEQAQAIAKFSPGIRVISSTWGHDDGLLNAREPLTWLKKFLWLKQQSHDLIFLRNGVYEIFNPRITWTNRLPFGGAGQIIEVNRRNFMIAKEKFGGIDLIHAHVSYPAGYVASVLSKEFCVPYIVTEHMSPFPFKSLIKKGFPIPEISIALNQADACIAVSSSLARNMESFGFFNNHVIPNMVDEHSFFIGEPKTDKIVFLTLCGITEQKGVDHLLQAIALWDPPADRFEFRIGGEGPMREYYQAMSHSLGLNDRVSWLGPVNRNSVPDLFRESHIYVMPSRHETFGVVYAEAIACGKPIIATRCGGPEQIVNKENGLLIDIGDAAGLSVAMQIVASNLKYYNPKFIRQDFIKRFSREAVVSQLNSIYNTILKK